MLTKISYQQLQMVSYLLQSYISEKQKNHILRAFKILKSYRVIQPRQYRYHQRLKANQPLKRPQKIQTQINKRQYIKVKMTEMTDKVQQLKKQNPNSKKSTLTEINQQQFEDYIIDKLMRLQQNFNLLKSRVQSQKDSSCNHSVIGYQVNPNISNDIFFKFNQTYIPIRNNISNDQESTYKKKMKIFNQDKVERRNKARYSMNEGINRNNLLGDYQYTQQNNKNRSAYRPTLTQRYPATGIENQTNNTINIKIKPDKQLQSRQPFKRTSRSFKLPRNTYQLSTEGNRPCNDRNTNGVICQLQEIATLGKFQESTREL